MNINLPMLKETFFTHLDSLKDFNFSFLNPVFWLLIFVLFLVLLKFWQTRKAFSFSLLTAAILLASTQIEIYLKGKLTPVAGQVDPFLFRLLTLFLIFVTLFYYALIKE